MVRCENCPVNPSCPDRPGFGIDPPKPNTCAKRVTRFTGLYLINLQWFLDQIAKDGFQSNNGPTSGDSVVPQISERIPKYSLYRPTLEVIELIDGSGEVVGYEHSDGSVEYF